MNAILNFIDETSIVVFAMDDQGTSLDADSQAARLSGCAVDELKTESCYKTIADNFPNGLVALFDRDLRCTLAGGQGLIHHGLNPNELEGKFLRDLFSAELYQPKEAALRASLQGQTTDMVISIGEEFFRIIVKPITDNLNVIIGGMMMAQNVTDLKQTELTLQRTLEEMHLVIQTARMGIWRLDIKTGQLLWNDQLFDIYGLDKQRVDRNPKEWRSRVHPDDLAHVNLRISEIYTGKPIEHLNFRVIRDDGQVRYVNASATPIRDDLGNLIELVGVNIDVTEKIRMESELREHEQRLDLVLKGADLGYWDWHVPTGDVIFNERWAAMLGYELHEIRPHVDSWGQLVHPDDLPGVMEALNRHLRGETPLYETEHRMLAKDGSWRWILDRGKVMDRDADGTPIRAAGTHLDVTDRKQAEEALVESEQQFRSLVEQSPAGIAIYDSDGILRAVNKAHAEQRGLGQTELDALIGRRSLLHSNVVQTEYASLLKRVFAGESVSTPEREAMVHKVLAELGHSAAPEKPLWLRTYLYPITGRNGEIRSIVQVDENVTEQHQAREALQRSQTLFETVFRHHPTAMQIFDVETGEQIDVNRSYLDVMGYSPEERLVHIPSPDRVWVDATQYQAARDRLLDKGQVKDYPAQLVTRTGERRDFLVSASLLNVDDGKLAVASYVDVTERKRARAALQKIQERYEKAFNSSHVAMEVVNLITGERFEVNDRFMEWTGYSREEIAGHTLSSLNMLVDEESRVNVIRKLLSERQLADYPVQGRTKHGEIRDLLLSGHMIDFDEEGLALISWIDVTARNQTDGLLRQLNQAIEQIPVSVVFTDRDGTIQYVNPRFSEVTGYAKEDIIGQDPGFLKSSVHSSKFYAHLWHTVQSGQAWQGEVCSRTKNGELVWESASIAGVKDDDGNITNYIAITEDITERRRAAEISARQDRLAAVGQLAAGIAHDFNNILAVIVIYAQMLAWSKDVPQRLRERAEIVCQQAKHASHLIEQILDFSRNSYKEKSPINLLPLLKEQIKLLKRTLPEHIELELHHSDDEYSLNADPTSLQQVITNLALNARDAMPTGGTLSISISKIAVNPGETRAIPNMTPGEWHKLSVSDTGTGMSAEVLQHIFEPFFTTKERSRGTGLGLAQVYGIVQQHEGFIDVHSQIGTGTTFDLYFPALAQPQTSPSALTKTPYRPQGTGQRILLVEDDDAVRLSLSDLLTEHCYSVITASNGLEALSILEEEPGVDLVLSDIIMPKMGGADLVARLSKSHPEIPIALMTGYTSQDEIMRFETLGVKAWFQKPVDIDSFTRSISALLSRHDNR